MKRKNDIKSKVARNQARLNKKKQNETGEGLFVFRNRSTTASIQLFKKSVDGKIWVDPGQTWTGDSSFLRMVPREASLVKTIENPQKKAKVTEEKVKVEEKIESQKVNKEVKKKTNKTVKKNSRKKKVNKEKNVMNEEKLLLDQPDQINNEGKLEHVVKPTSNIKQLKEVKNDEEKMEESLLTEDPLSGVTIINE